MNTSFHDAIIIRDLVKNYGEHRALDHLTLNIKRGELFCLLGPNGGGKSTLFRILSTLLQPDHGEAEIVGHSNLGTRNVSFLNKHVTPWSGHSPRGVRGYLSQGILFQQVLNVSLTHRNLRF